MNFHTSNQSEDPNVSVFNGKMSININTGERDSVEDLEEERKQQEELRNYLYANMSDYHSDSQSTVNSSKNISAEFTDRNEGLFLGEHNKENLLRENTNTAHDLYEKYEKVGPDHQLKVLYEIRVNEVHALKDKVDEITGKMKQLQTDHDRTKTLLEAEKNKSKISQEQSQTLLVGKNEEIMKLKAELDGLRGTVNNLERTLKTVNDEKDAFKLLNNELGGQLNLMHAGLTTNTVSDKELHEKYQREMTQMQYLLDNADSQLKQKGKEYSQLEKNFKDKCKEMDDIVVEKSTTINILTQNLQQAQERYREYVQAVESLMNENRDLKQQNANVSNDTEKSARLLEKTELMNAMKRELDKAREVESAQRVEIETLKREHSKSVQKGKEFEVHIAKFKRDALELVTKNNELEKKLEVCLLEMDLMKRRLLNYNDIETERNTYKEKFEQLQITSEELRKHKVNEHSIQVSLSSVDEFEKENENLRKELNDTHLRIQELTEKLIEAENKISVLSLTVSLEKERDGLIKSLQEKAAQFEKIIKEKQKELVTIGTNTTDNHSEEKFNDDVLRIEHQIRTELQKEYEAKLEEVQEICNRNSHKSVNCGTCPEFMSKLQQQELLLRSRNDEIDKMKRQNVEDRETVAVLLENCKGKFENIDKEKRELTDNYLNVKKRCEVLTEMLNVQRTGEAKLYDTIRKECQKVLLKETIDQWNKKTLREVGKFTLAHEEKIKKYCARVDECSRVADEEVLQINTAFEKKRNATQHAFKNSYHRN